MAAQSFAGKAEPYSIRGARLLLYLECALLILSALFAAMIGILLGSGNSIPFAGIQVSGSGAVLLGAFYGALGLAALYFAVELRRLQPWTRIAVVVLQAVLIVLFLARGDLSPATALSVALCLAVVGLLLTPSAGAALAGAQGSEELASSGSATTSSSSQSSTAQR